MQTTTDKITIRTAGSTDVADLERLAALDSSTVPAGDLLVAEADGTLLAALAIGTGAAIADPFKPTAAVVDLLRVRAASKRRERRGRSHAAIRRGRHAFAA